MPNIIEFIFKSVDKASKDIEKLNSELKQTKIEGDKAKKGFGALKDGSLAFAAAGVGVI